MHTTDRPFSRALFNAGNSIEARIAMIAMTTSNSIKVNDLTLNDSRRYRIAVFRNLHLSSSIGVEPTSPALVVCVAVLLIELPTYVRHYLRLEVTHYPHDFKSPSVRAVRAESCQATHVLMSAVPSKPGASGRPCHLSSFPAFRKTRES